MNSLILIIILGFAISTTTIVKAEPLERDESSDVGPVDFIINPNEALPANGTVIKSTVGTDDIDINSAIPENVTIIIQSDRVMMTNITTEIEFPE